MFSILSIGYSFKGSKNQLNILFFSASTLLLYNPMYLLDIGFQLSYSALIGITLCYKPLVDSMKLNNRFIKYTWNISALCLSAQLFTFPLCLFYFHQFPNYFLITNIGVALFSGYVIGLGLLFLLTSKMSIIASLIGILFSFSLTTLTLFVKKIESLPASVSRGFELNIYDLIYLIALCIGLYWFLLKKRKPLSGGVILLIIAFSISAKRFQQITHKHFVLFNSNKFSCAYYDSKNIYFFHDNLKKNKITALLRDYKSVFPGNIIISNIGKNNYELRSKTHSIVFNKNNKKMNLAIDNQDYEIIYRQYNQPMKRVKTIGMSWVENTNIRLNKAYFFDF
jgi:competence protein ComEC